MDPVELNVLADPLVHSSAKLEDWSAFASEPGRTSHSVPLVPLVMALLISSTSERSNVNRYHWELRTSQYHLRSDLKLLG
jgi:hypothetical protein